MSNPWEQHIAEDEAWKVGTIQAYVFTILALAAYFYIGLLLNVSLLWAIIILTITILIVLAMVTD